MAALTTSGRDLRHQRQGGGAELVAPRRAVVAYWAGFGLGRDHSFRSWTTDAAGTSYDPAPTWGCIATTPKDAVLILCFVEIGTRVGIHW